MLVIFWVFYVYDTCIILEKYTKYKGKYGEKQKARIHGNTVVIGFPATSHPLSIQFQANFHLSPSWFL